MHPGQQDVIQAKMKLQLRQRLFILSDQIPCQNRQIRFGVNLEHGADTGHAKGVAVFPAPSIESVAQVITFGDHFGVDLTIFLEISYYRGTGAQSQRVAAESPGS